MKKLIIALGALTLASLSFSRELTSSPAVTQEVLDEGFEPGPFQNLKALPAMTISAIPGIPGAWGTVFAGGSFRSNKSETDAALAFGTGWGDADLGGLAVLEIGSIDPRDGGSFNRGALDFSVGHIFSDYGLGASLGITNINLWHEKSSDSSDPSFYLSGTKMFANDIAPVMLTAGLGNNDFVTFKRGRDFKNKIDGFGAIAVYIHPQVSLIADYTAGLTAAGVSFVPVKTWPLSITLGADDIFEQSVEEAVSFIASVGLSYTF